MIPLLTVERQAGRQDDRHHILVPPEQGRGDRGHQEHQEPAQIKPLPVEQEREQAEEQQAHVVANDRAVLSPEEEGPAQDSPRSERKQGHLLLHQGVGGRPEDVDQGHEPGVEDREE